MGSQWFQFCVMHNYKLLMKVVLREGSYGVGCCWSSSTLNFENERKILCIHFMLILIYNHKHTTTSPICNTCQQLSSVTLKHKQKTIVGMYCKWDL
jgi:predicted metal-binding membrane protein